MLSRKQGDCSTLIGQELKRCEVMLQLKQFRFEAFRNNDHTCYFFKATEVIEDSPSKTRGYVTSFSKIMQLDEFHHLTSSFPSSTEDDKCSELLRLAMLVPTSGPSGRMNNKGNLTLSFEATQNCSYLLAKVSRRICNTLYIIEVLAEVNMDNIEKASNSVSHKSELVLAGQPRGPCEALVSFKLYDPLSSIILQTASWMILESGLDARREQVYSAMERLHVVESSEGKAAVLRYTRTAMTVTLSEATHSAACSKRGHSLPLTVGISCREGKATNPLLLIHASINEQSRLNEGNKFLFHPLVPLPPLSSVAYIDDPENRTEFDELYTVLDDLYVVVESLQTGQKITTRREWQLWHPAQSRDVKVSHLSRRVQSARSLDYTINQKSASDAAST